MGQSLRRYTSIPAMLDMLTRQRLTLLAPSSWSDRNDREVMARYASLKAGSRVFACCLAEGDETAHHWQVFADRGQGACVKFDKDRLLASVAGFPEVRHRGVAYLQWKEMKPTSGRSESLPFLKRSVFRFEREYRIVAVVPGLVDDIMTYSLPLPLSCITSIYLSGELPDELFATLRAIIRRTPGCAKIVVRHSGLLRNANWSRSLSSLAATES